MLSVVYRLSSVSSAQEFHFIPQNQKSRTFYSGRPLAETLSWVVKLKTEALSSHQKLDSIADLLASDTRLLNLGQVGELRGHYLFASPMHRRILNSLNFESAQQRNYEFQMMTATTENLTAQGNISQNEWSDAKLRLTRSLDEHPSVEWYIQQVIHRRSKRDLLYDGKTAFRNLTDAASVIKRRQMDWNVYNPLHFNDPAFFKLWHLINTINRKRDINVTGVWLHNITGRGVTIAVIDDGLEWNNPDLLVNYNKDGSFDLNSNDADPSPSGAKDTNHHGTRCAGEIAAVANNAICGVGVAYGAKVSGIRILDGPMTDDLEAVAFMKRLDVNDIYSCSWGPEDDGKTVDGPQHLAMTAMRHGVTFGRRGYGAIYVVASGNGGRTDDNCNYDGYANSIYTVTVGAIDENGAMPYYGEPCASMLAVTYSSGGGGYQRNIVTTDWTKNGGTGCTENHSGTSAAAPIASSLIGLMLEARPCLTWRDVQYIIAVTAVKVDVLRSEWVRNAAGLFHSHQHGFGELKAWRMVNTAKVWKPIPWLTSFTSDEIQTEMEIPPIGYLESKFNVTERMLDGYYLNTMEYVHVKITLNHECRGDLGIELVCPSNTVSVIGAPRKLDTSGDGFKGWIFSTVRCWGEKPSGVWTLKITDSGAQNFQSRGMLIKWQLQLYGSMMSSEDVTDRISLVKESESGKYLNASFQLPCPSPILQTQQSNPISERILKILFMTSCFIVFMACYETLEYAFCYNEEKKEHANLLSLGQSARQLAGQHSSEETTRLLPAEEIEMESVGVDRPVTVGNNHGAYDSSGIAAAAAAERDLLLGVDEILTDDAFNDNRTTDETEDLPVPFTRCNEATDGDLLLAVAKERIPDVADEEKAILHQ